MNNRVGTEEEKIKANINSKVKFWGGGYLNQILSVRFLCALAASSAIAP